MIVCVIGGGGQLAEAVSAWVTERGHHVVHYRPEQLAIPGVPGRPARPISRLERFETFSERLAQTSGRQGRYRWIGKSEAHKADVFIYCLPSYLAELVGAQLAAATSGKYILNLSDRFMGTVAFSRSARRILPQWKSQAAVAFNSPPALAYQRIRNATTSILYTKPFVLAAPADSWSLLDSSDLVNEIFGISEIKWHATTLELAFENINSIVHAVQDLMCLKMGFFGSPGSLYDRETYTSDIVTRINRVTRDRDAVARRYTLNRYRSLEEFDATTFRTVSDFNPGTPEYRHHHPLLASVPRPSVATAHGYEDIGWSMVPMESLGLLAGVATPALSDLIDDWSRYMGVDYRMIGRTAATLGISKLDVAVTVPDA